jgi:hypothetical protein
MRVSLLLIADLCLTMSVAFMNDPFVIGAADGILHRAFMTASNDADARVERLYRLIYNRLPGDPARVLAREFLGQLPAEPDRWRSFAQALLMANEFVYVD